MMKNKLLMIVFLFPLLSSCISPTTEGMLDYYVSVIDNDIQYGDKLHLDGLKVTGIFKNGERQLRNDEYVIESSTFDSFSLGTYDVNVAIPNFEKKVNFDVDVVARKSIKLLMIGNSFSDDTIEYAYHIFKSLGVTNIELGNLYIGGCDIDTHYYNITNDLALYRYSKWENNTWIKEFGGAKEAIQDEMWDFISFQQSSPLSGIETSYTQVTALRDLVLGLCKNKYVQPVWNMTWAYQANSTHSAFSDYNNDQIEMFNRIIDCNKLIKSHFATIIPTGTAIQNARTSYYGDTYTRDGYHLAYGAGRYLAGLTLAGTLLGRNIVDISYLPDSMFEAEKEVAIEAAINALKNPFVITPSEFID